MWRFAQVLAAEGEFFPNKTDPGTPPAFLVVFVGALLLVGVACALYWLFSFLFGRNDDDHFPRPSGRIDPHQL